MATSDDLQALADAARAGMHRLLREISLLGPKPPAPPAADAWQAEADRLEAEIGRLTELAQNLSAEAVANALSGFQEDTARLREVSEHARERVAAIAKVSAVLTTVAAILDVGTAVLALAAAPSLGRAEALGDKVLALSHQLDPDRA